MTEDKAKKKVCPIFMMPMVTMQLAQAGANRPDSEIEGAGKLGLCVASDCMMWHWYEWTLDKEQRLTDEGVAGRCGLAK